MFVRGKSLQKRLDFVRNTFKMFVLIGNRVSPLDRKVAVIFPQIWRQGGGDEIFQTRVPFKSVMFYLKMSSK